MTGFWAKFAHGVAIAGQLVVANHMLIPAVATPYVQVGLAIGQLIVGAMQHNTNPDGTPAAAPYIKPGQ